MPFHQGTPFLCQFVDKVVIRPGKKYNKDFRYFLTQELKIIPEDYHLSKKSVLILSSNLDVEADLVGIELFRRGIDYVRLNVEDIPFSLKVGYTLGPQINAQYHLKIGSSIIFPSGISLVLLRYFDYSPTDFYDNYLNAEFIRQQWNDALQMLYASLNCEWINTPDAARKSSNRITQLDCASKIGFNIPSTLITNDPDRAREFYHQNNGHILLKALHHHDIEIQNEVYSIYSHPVNDEDLNKFGDLLYAPCILQEKLPKRSELRVIVIGNKVFAVEIESEAVPTAKDDIHRAKLSQLPKRAVQLNEEDQLRCVRIIESLGLKYGAIDFIVGEDSRLTFLEVNPAGDWIYIENQTELQITNAFVDLIESIIGNV